MDAQSARGAARLFGGGDAVEDDVARLRAALRRERARGLSGHWTYDITRHLALVTRLKKVERARADGSGAKASRTGRNGDRAGR